MTGWRIGWMVVPQPLVRPIERLQGNLAISVPTLSQIAAEAAFDGRDELEAIKHGYEDNRKILIEGLPKAGPRQVPAGRRRVLSLRRRLATSPTTASTSPSACWRRRMSRRRPASISIRSTAGTSCASATRARPPTCARRWSGSAAGSSAAEARDSHGLTAPCARPVRHLRPLAEAAPARPGVPCARPAPAALCPRR